MTTRTEQRVSDEAWAAAPRRRLPYAAVMSAVVAFTFGLVVLIGAWQRGLLVPQLGITTSGSAAKAGSATFDYRFYLENRGGTDITVTDITAGAPWLTVAAITRPQQDWQGAGALESPKPLLPLVVAPSTTEEIRIVLEVDCAARTDDAVPLLFDVDGFARSHTVALQPDPSQPLFAGTVPPDGMDPYTSMPWPQGSMDWVCNPYRGDPA
jgi:hypothetical protein